MKKRILYYNKQISELISKNSPETNWHNILEDLLIQISFFQHERLIHLIVTITFALLAIITVLIILLTENLITLLLFAAIFCLLIPYIKHYYLLENEVQKMYTYYDKINEIIHNDNKPKA